MRAISLFIILSALALFSCGGGGSTPEADSGSIAGTIAIGGPLSSMTELTVGVFSPGGTTAIQEYEAGNSTSVATGSRTERQLTFSFTELDFGSYEIAVYSGAGTDRFFYYRSEQQTLTAGSPNITGFSETMSYSGPEPWGTISGVIDLADGTWPADKYVYLGFKNGDNPRLQYPVTEGYAYDGYVEHVVADSQIIFNIAFLVYGEWTVGFYGYDYTTHQVTVYGERDVAVLIHGGNPNATNVNFPAAFTGDPGTDPVLGTIAGTITFNGELPSGPFISIGANTIPPQQGAPIATYDVTPEMVGTDMTLDFTLTDVPHGTYGVAIFTYDFSTHTVTYFGEYPDSITLSETTPDVTGIDFNADVTLIQ
ncbi:hypothetical protein JW859_00225 [bacterium]|nr:hypothetical protein [bacterium]